MIVVDFDKKKKSMAILKKVNVICVSKLLSVVRQTLKYFFYG